LSDLLFPLSQEIYVLTRFLEIAVMLLFVYTIVTQMLIPALQDVPLFPLFRSNEAKLQAKLLKLAQEQHEQDMQHLIDQTSAELHPPAAAPSPSDKT
jgi:hypothetical protein